MNEVIKGLMEYAVRFRLNPDSNAYEAQVTPEDLELFAELIVKECIEQGKQIQSQTVSNGSKDYSDGRKMGIEVYMNQIQKHFGVEE